MKNFIYILSAIVLLLLTSCYESDFLNNRMVKDIKTLPPTISDQTITLEGEFGDMNWVDFYFQVGRSKDLSQGETILHKDFEPLVKNYLDGTYYYRACAIAGNDTVYAPNVESFTVNNEIQMGDIKIDRTIGDFYFTSNIESSYAGVLLSTDSDFKESFYYKSIHSYPVDGHYQYWVSTDQLEPGVTYYVKAFIEVLLGSLESTPSSFTTEDNRINSVGIYGNDIDGKPITDDLMVVIQNLSSHEWSQPYTAIYNQSKKNYEILGFDYRVESGTWYAAYAVTAKGAIWDESGYVVFGQGDYQYGAAQVPICWGVAEINGSDPYIKMELIPWTSQITVEYPAAWGQVDTKEYGLAIFDKTKQLPGSAYEMNSRKSLQEYGSYFGKPSEEATLSADGTKYSFTFNIFPTQLSSSNCSMILYLVNAEREVPCPDLGIEMGKHYTITFESNDLDITDVTVKEWEATNGGSITINP